MSSLNTPSFVAPILLSARCDFRLSPRVLNSTLLILVSITNEMTAALTANTDKNKPILMYNKYCLRFFALLKKLIIKLKTGIQY